MLLDVLGLLVIVIVAAVAFGAGVWFANMRAAATPPQNEESDDVRRARDALTRIHDVASRVAADVDEHSTRVREINDELGASERGQADVVTAITKLIASNEQMQQQLDSAEEKLQQQAIEIKTHLQEARTDALTKTANRRALDVVLARCAADFNREGKSVSLVMIDIDHFKKVNDFHGHQAGDAVLSEAAQVIRRALPDPAFVGRYGGEEFAIILPGVPIADAVKKAEHVRRQIQQSRFNWRGKELRITVSAGVAEMQPGDDAAMLVNRADKALYQSKQSSRNCGHWHDGETIRRIGLDPVIATKKRVAGEQTGISPAEPESSNAPPRQAPGSAPQTPGSAPQTPAKSGAPSGPATEPSPATASPAAAQSPANPAAPTPAGSAAPPGGEEPGVLGKLADRQSFAGDVRRRMAEWGRGGAPVSVVMVRVKDYQDIVRQRGPEAGEVSLKTCAQFIQAAMRDLDNVARWETDCFALLLPGAKLAGAKNVAERLQQAIQRCRERTGGSRLGLIIQCGAAEVQDGDDTDALLARCFGTLDDDLGHAENREQAPAQTASAPLVAPDGAQPDAVGAPST